MTDATKPTLTEEEKYKPKEWDSVDTAKVAGITAAAAGKGNPIAGAKNIGKATWQASKVAGAMAGDAYRFAGGVRGMWNGAKVFGGGLLKRAPAIGGAVAAAYTPTEDYYERFGFSRDRAGDSLPQDIGVRALGYASDVGNSLFLNLLGDHLFDDKIRQRNEELAKQKATTPAPTSATESAQKERIYHSSQPSNPIKVGGVGGIGQSLPNAPQATQYQGGIKMDNPNYQALMNQVGQAGRALSNPENLPNLGIRTHAPQRNWENEAQRRDLMRQATTVQKGARGITAAQMRLAHDLSNDDIKLAQERHLQQNNLNHQLLQEQLQQQGQNQRTMLGETGQMARAVMNEQGQNARFNTNFGLDVAKFNQDAQNTQYELGLKGADLSSRLQSQAIDDSVKAGHIDLYNQFINAKDDEQRDKILTQMAVLMGKGGGGQQNSGGSLKDNFIVMTDKDGNDKLVDLRTMQGGQSQGNPDWHNDPTILKGIEQVNKKGGTADEIRQAYIALGVPADQVDAVLAQQQG